MKLPPAGIWVGRGLAVLGLLAVVRAVQAANVWALVAALGGFVAATGLALAPLVRVWLADGPLTRPSDFEHVVDLVRRAHGAAGAWAVGLAAGDIEVAEPAVGRPARQRGAALVQLASVDGRAHVARESFGSYVAVGDFPFGAGLLLAQPDVTPARAEAVAEELRRVVASMRLAQLHEPTEQPAQLVSKQLAAIAGGAQTLDGIAKAGVELAHQVAQRGAAIVLPAAGAAHAGGGGGRVAALSAGIDSRLDLAVPADAPVMRSIQSGIPVAAQGSDDIFGAAIPDRRRSERAGTAYPLRDGHFVIGALVVTGPPIPPATPAADLLQRLVADLGSRLAAARAVHEAEQRAVRDPLTGLANRREFDRRCAIAAGKPPAFVTLVFVDIDHFKRLNDSLGHQAGDAALRHVADILRQAVRDNDLVARIGGEEFAIWMPHTPIEVGLEVAGRIRASVEHAAWRWNGEVHSLTISCGVSSYPDSVQDLENLRSTADAALYAAKQRGRNRVERAQGGATR